MGETVTASGCPSRNHCAGWRLRKNDRMMNLRRIVVYKSLPRKRLRESQEDAGVTLN
jgi:hypothetical protein